MVKTLRELCLEAMEEVTAAMREEDTLADPYVDEVERLLKQGLDSALDAYAKQLHAKVEEGARHRLYILQRVNTHDFDDTHLLANTVPYSDDEFRDMIESYISYQHTLSFDDMLDWLVDIKGFIDLGDEIEAEIPWPVSGVTVYCTEL